MSLCGPQSERSGEENELLSLLRRGRRSLSRSEAEKDPAVPTGTESAKYGYEGENPRNEPRLSASRIYSYKTGLI